MLKLYRHLTPYSASVAAILLLLLCQSLADLALPTLMADMIDHGVLQGNGANIWRAGRWMLLVVTVGAACAILGAYLSARVTAAFSRDVRGRVFQKISDFSLRTFDRFGPATLMTRATGDVTQVQGVTIMILRMMVAAPITAVGGLILALSKDPGLSLVLLAGLPVLAAVVGTVLALGLPLFRAVQQKLDRLTRVTRENLTGVRVVRAFDGTAREERRFGDANADLTGAATRVNRIMSALFPALFLIMNLTSLAIVWHGGLRVEAGQTRLGDLMAFLQYTMQIMFSFFMLSMMFVMLPRAAASAARINEVLDAPAGLPDPPAPRTAPAAGHVAFEDVTFAHPGAEQPALNGVSFRTGPGEVTAVLGGTGAGKSTLVNLLLRFADPQGGRIELDGQDVRAFTQADLRGRVAYVPQRAVLFTGSVLDNLRFGHEALTEEEARRALTTAQALDFVEAMGGLDARVEQGGANLSGGQRQRLAIARALARPASVYVFDDSFSALDYRTDARLRAALREETHHAAVVVVAQRVGSVLDADRILVLDEGRVVGLGRHEDLLHSSAVYREIVASQMPAAEQELA